MLSSSFLLKLPMQTNKVYYEWATRSAYTITSYGLCFNCIKGQENVMAYLTVTLYIIEMLSTLQCLGTWRHWCAVKDSHSSDMSYASINPPIQTKPYKAVIFTQCQKHLSVIWQLPSCVHLTWLHRAGMWSYVEVTTKEHSWAQLYKQIQKIQICIWILWQQGATKLILLREHTKIKEYF